MLVLLATILPSIIIVLYFVRSDKFKEPSFEIVKIFFYGILITIPAFYLNTYLGNILETKTKISEPLIGSFLTAAPVEEGLKFFILFYFVYKMKDFNEPIDGIVYGVCVSLGFATLENIYYVYALTDYFETTPLSLAILRAFSAVPAHAMFGAIMGIFYSSHLLAKKKEDKKMFLILSILVPFLLHGFYNYFMYSMPILGFVLVIVGIYFSYTIFIKWNGKKRFKI